MRRVVITGIGAVTPVGNDIETMWDSLVNGKNGIDYIKSFDTEKLKVKVAAEVKDFDPTKYIEKKELRKTDLFCQYAIAAACQAVEDSGIIGTIEDEKLGVYVGSGTGGMHTFFTQCENMIAEKKISPFFIPMMIGNMAAGLIAIRFSAKGPCLPVVTACATSTHAVGEAFHAIKNGYADAIITGGAEAAITPLAIAGFSSCMALSTRNDPNSSSIPFDKRRDGFVMGEGAGILVLEEYEHAVARGAKIYAEVAGYGNTCDAHHVTAPDPEAAGAARCVEIALKEAGITDDDTLYINACAAHSYAGSYWVRFYMILVKTGKEVLNVPPYNALRSIADIIGSCSNGAYHKLIAAEASAYLIFNRDTAYSIRHGAYGKVALVMAVMVVDVFKSVII